MTWLMMMVFFILGVVFTFCFVRPGVFSIVENMNNIQRLGLFVSLASLAVAVLSFLAAVVIGVVGIFINFVGLIVGILALL